MRAKEFILENAQVRYPVTPAILKQAKESSMGFVYWGQAVAQSDAGQCFAMINKTIEAMLKSENCKFNLKNMRPNGNTLAIVPNDEDFPVLECDYDTMIKADGKVYHTVGIDAGYGQKTSKGFVTSLIAQLYKGMEYLHGPGQRIMEINDDKGAGVWQNIMSKLGAISEPLEEDVMDEIGYDDSFNYSVDRDGINLRAYIKEAGTLVIVATAGGKQLGHVEFMDFGDTIKATKVEVDERYQRQGIATLMYDFAEELGNDIEPSSALTDQGKAFWQQRRPELELDENFADGQVNEGTDFNQCYAQACKLYDKADAENLNPILLQVADYKGDESTASTEWLKIPARLWQHYVTIVGDTVLDPTAKQFGPDKPTKYSRSQLSQDWNKQYQIKPKEVNENFADGQVKGKSRPGRVKRAGASCKGSVTDLQARAKKASGERKKMYQWCANMKGGQNK